MARVEHHPLGPRVFVFGRRVHEFSVGLVLAAGLLVASWAGRLHASSSLGVVLLLLAGWLVAKDWRDLFPSSRDTGSWRVGMHRRFPELRATRHSDGLPVAAALFALVVASVNIVSALTPDVPARARLLLRLEPVATMPLSHAAALPASVALAVVAVYLQRRRRRALIAAVALLAIAGALDVLKGLDIEEALLSWGLACLLWWGRAAFCVRHEKIRLRSRIMLIPLLVAGSAALASGTVSAAARGDAGFPLVVRETGYLLMWRSDSMWLADGFGWLPFAVGALGLATLLACASILFRPLAETDDQTEPAVRRAAFDLVRLHGRDTLAFFKLRADSELFFSSDQSAFLSYRTENGVLLVSGDPIGAPEALPGLLVELCAFAEHRGLRLGAVGASQDLLALYAQAGLRALYIGDEAVVDTRQFTLEGRAVRKVRQSVNRLEAAGYTTAACRLDEIDSETRAALERVSTQWRNGAAERGFSMAMESLDCEHQAETVVVIARDRGGSVRGYLHFVPSYGRAAMSLSSMRRDRDTPNGLTEFLVVRAIELMRAQGVEELSLNFAAFARWIYGPRGRVERLLGRLISLANPFFQIESIYRFNAKFSPRWTPRYLLYEGMLDLPRIGLATMRAEGQLPRLVRRPTRVLPWPVSA